MQRIANPSKHIYVAPASSWSRRVALSSPIRRAAGWIVRRRAVRSQRSIGCTPMALQSRKSTAWDVCCATGHWCWCPSQRLPIIRISTIRSIAALPATRWVALCRAMCKCGRVSCHDIYDMFFINMFSLLFAFLWQLWRRPTKWMWRYYPRRAAAPPFCVVWCPRLSRNWYEWSRGFMNPLSTSIPRCKAVSSEEDGGTSHIHTHGRRRGWAYFVVSVWLSAYCCCCCWRGTTRSSGWQPRLHPCPCAAAYQANKVHCLFAVFASHVCLLNCQRFWLFGGARSMCVCVCIEEECVCLSVRMWVCEHALCFDA